MSTGLAKGTLIGGDFRILEELAEGGMGSVYVAEQVSTGKRRALKVMKPHIVTDARSRRRFVEEAKIGARIASEHVVEVIAAGVDETAGVPWLAMELLEGTDLEAHVQAHGPLSLPELIEFYEQLAHALGEAHGQGVVHRDLKPENLFLARSRRVGGRPVLKVLDFGIAAFVSADKTAATVTTAIGSPLWVAPEQMATGAKLRPSTDVFAMGLIAFYLLTGKSYWRAAHAVPFSLNPLIAEIVALPLVSASERAKDLGGAALPSGFDAWFGRCVVREAEARFADAFQAFEALARLGVASPTVEAYAPTEGLPSDLASASVPPTRSLRTPDPHPGVAATLVSGAPAASIEPGSREASGVGPTLPLGAASPTASHGPGSGTVPLADSAPGAPVSVQRRAADHSSRSPRLKLVMSGAAVALVGLGTVLAFESMGAETAEPDSSEAPSAPASVQVELRSAFDGELVVDGESHGDISRTSPRTMEFLPGAHVAHIRAGAPRLQGVVWGERSFEVVAGVALAPIVFEDPCEEGAALVLGPASSLCVDRTEVTVAAFIRAVRAGRIAPPTGARDEACNWTRAESRQDHPMNCVSYDEAVGFCRAARGRLPTEAEWTRAASGTRPAVYPWGDEPPNASRLRWSGDGNGRGSAGGTSPVGSHSAGVSPFGVEDLAGNVFEWTASSRDPRAIRGGSWADAAGSGVRVDARAEVPASTRSGGLGFRCVRDVSD